MKNSDDIVSDHSLMVGMSPYADFLISHVQELQLELLAKKHNATTHGIPGSLCITTKNLAKLISEVEQVMLERAAGVLRSAIDAKDDVVTDLFGDIDPVARRVVDVMAIRVLALKDSHD